VKDARQAYPSQWPLPDPYLRGFAHLSLSKPHNSTTYNDEVWSIAQSAPTVMPLGFALSASFYDRFPRPEVGISDRPMT